MLIKNEENQFVELSAYADMLLQDGLGEDSVTEEDAQQALSELYLHNQQEQSTYFISQPVGLTALTIDSINLAIPWRDFKNAFCNLIKEDSISGKIIEYVLQAIALVTGSNFILKLAKVILTYVLKKGVNRLCGS
ncbi:hypothetical protein [Sphingobacterium paucimobilis]|uniref:Uncharacterized protein n=1 Tax=Sphingobacterium paucimobilis HER1398 TaxID=1346330 RepID=U2J6W9_9SPHI|nr:hypothetical protein [Sphingobacterium paucimobilis]ERJ60659.1 hypothetical protein M472_18030 [Sphingobacterium paucimobilis HER1398]